MVLKRGVTTPFTHVEKLPNMTGYLFLHTEGAKVVLDLEEFRPHYAVWDTSKPNDLKSPSLVKNTDFLDWVLSNGMENFKWGSNLSSIASPGSIVVTSVVDDVLGIINDTFLIWDTFVRNKWFFESTGAGMAKPIMEIVEGKLLVHESTGVFGQDWDNSHTVFKVCDLVKGIKEDVDVPYAIKSNGLIRLPPYTALGCFVIGSKLFIPSDVKKLHCFDVNTMKWDSRSSSNLLESFNKAGFVQCPLFGRCVSVPGFDEGCRRVMVCLQDFGFWKAQKPYAYLIDETEILLCHQDLSKGQELFNDFLPKVARGVESRFIDLGSGKVCAILYGRDKGKTDVFLHICIFELKKSTAAVDDIPLNPLTSPTDEKEFVSVKIINKYFCKLTELVGCKPSPLNNAFFL